MDYRSAILAELKLLYQQGPEAFALADSLRCFSPGDQSYLTALQQLLAEGLVRGISSGINDRIAISLNPEKISAIAPSVHNEVTVNLAPGATFTGPFAVGLTITQAFSTASSASEQTLKTALEALVKETARLAEALADESAKVDVSARTKVLVEQATQERPSKPLIEFSAKGLIEAAKAVSALAEPIAKAVTAVLSLLK